jgi:hypothetical protein
MPFDPKLIEGEPAPLDDSGEIILPQELHELADRLRIESQRLSSQYVTHVVPSSAANVATSDRSNTAGGSIGWRALAVLLTCGLVILLIGRPAGTPIVPTRNEQRPAAGTSVPAARQETSSPASSSPTSALPASSPPAVGSRPITRATDGATELSDDLLREVSGPELEGLLDLLEKDSSKSNRVSI